jgi:hypothetical protein
MIDNSNPKAWEIIRISVKELRRKFNEGQFWDRANRGELTKVVLSRHIPASSNEPPGTESQIISLRDANGHEVARVHAYIRPDNTLSASGLPDPKIVEEGNARYMQERKC